MPSPPPPTVPTAFVNEVVVQNLQFVSAMRYLPGGKILAAEISGTIRVVQAGANQADTTPFNTVANVFARR